MADSEDERRLIRFFERRGVARQRAEARVVVRVRLDAIREDVEPIKLGSAPGGNRRHLLESLLRDPLRRARGVVLGAHVDLERAEELLALRDRLRMGDHLAEIVDRRPR